MAKFDGIWPSNVTLMTYFSFLYNFCYKPYLAKIEGITNDGMEMRNYLRQLQSTIVFFDVSSLKSDDIIVSIIYNPKKKKEVRRYYVVESNTDQELNLRGGDKNGIYNTYQKVLDSMLSKGNGKTSEIIQNELFAL